MKYSRFEDLPVWQLASDLAARIFPWSRNPVFRGVGDLANQLQRASLSISNNIAEGFERGSTTELIHFVYYARGSAGEVRSMLAIMEQMNEFEQIRQDIARFKATAESISRELRGWADSLQNSEVRGQRHLNDKSRAAYQNKKARDRFQSEIKGVMEQRREKIEQQLRAQRSTGMQSDECDTDDQPDDA